MTTPTPGRPGQSVNPGGDFQISSSFNQLVQSIEGLQQTIATQVSVMERQANAQARYAATSLGTLPQVTDPALQRLQQAGGAGPSLAGPTSQVPGLGALSSLQGLQTFTSRRLGNWLAGTPAVHSGWGDPAGHVQLSRCPGWCGRAASQRRLCCRSGFSVVLGGICAIGAAAALQGGCSGGGGGGLGWTRIAVRDSAGRPRGRIWLPAGPRRYAPGIAREPPHRDPAVAGWAAPVGIQRRGRIRHAVSDSHRSG
jgi:hypothetical protein